MNRQEMLILVYDHLRNVGVVHTKKELAEKIGFEQTNLSSAFSGSHKYLTDGLFERIGAAFPDIFNKNWLLTGEGEMLKNAPSLPQPRKKIPVYDSQTIGGLNGTVANVDDSAMVSEEIDAGDWFPEATAAMHHYGDSMVEYPSGSILALKRVNDKRLIINGRNYVIETTEFRVTKQLQYDGGDVIMAYSSNTETYPDGRQIHSPIRIPVETVRYIDLVLGCVTKEYSNGAVIIRKR